MVTYIPRFLSLVLVFLASAPVAVCHADTVNIFGASLPVDELTKVDSSNSKLTVFGNSQIVANENLSKAVIEAYAANDTAFFQIDNGAWERLITSAIQQGGADKVKSAVEKLITSNPKEAYLCDRLKGWLAASNDQTLGKPLLQSSAFENYHDNCKIFLMLETGRRNADWFRANALSKGYNLKDELADIAVKDWSKAVIAGDLTTARQIAEFLPIFSEGTNSPQEKLKLATDLTQGFLAKGENQTLADLLPLISLRNSDHALAHGLTPVVINFIHGLVERALQSQDSEKALNLLSNIRIDERTPTTHDLILRSISSLSLNSYALSGKQIKELLLVVAKNDPKVAGEIAAYYERKLRAMRERGAFAEDRSVFNELLLFRPDPNELNDGMRVEHALSLLGRSDRSGAQDVLTEVVTDLPFSSRVELLLSGLYGNVLLYVMILCLPFIIKLGMGIIKPAKRPAAFEEAPPTAEDILHNMSGEGVISQQAKMFVTNRSSRQLNPLYDEYLECLKVFELDESADFRSIKMAYRNAVKEIHPDLNLQNQSPDASERFIRLTKAYDRIRELHKQLNISEG